MEALLPQVKPVNYEEAETSRVALRVDAVTKAYGKSRVLSDFSLVLRPGQVHGLLGPNGSGKTTGLHVITGLVRQDKGTVKISGVPIESSESRGLLGFAPDDLPLPLHLSAGEFLDFHNALRDRDDRARSATLARMLDLDIECPKRLVHFSHGMKRKVQLISALMHVPDVLVLDEPFRGLDPRTAKILREIIAGIADSGTAVLVATHDMLRAERDCDEVTILADGRTIASGVPSDLLKNSKGSRDLEDVFLALTEHPAGPTDEGLRLESLFNQI